MGFYFVWDLGTLDNWVKCMDIGSWSVGAKLGQPSNQRPTPLPCCNAAPASHRKCMEIKPHVQYYNSILYRNTEWL